MSIDTLKTALKDSCTTPNGDYDPARIVGYGMSVVGAAVFFFCTIYIVIKTGEFDATNYAIGLGALATVIVSAAGGVVLKKSDEIPYTNKGEPADSSTTGGSTM